MSLLCPLLGFRSQIGQITFLSQMFEYRNFDFWALASTRSSFLNNNIEKRNTGSDSQGGWQDVFARVASWTAFSLRSSKTMVWSTFFQVAYTFYMSDFRGAFISEFWFFELSPLREPLFWPKCQKTHAGEHLTGWLARILACSAAFSFRLSKIMVWRRFCSKTAILAERRCTFLLSTLCIMSMVSKWRLKN